MAPKNQQTFGRLSRGGVSVAWRPLLRLGPNNKDTFASATDADDAYRSRIELVFYIIRSPHPRTHTGFVAFEASDAR